MKTKITLLVLFLTTLGFAQNGINYKAVIKDNVGNIVANDLIVVQFSILQGVAQTNVYTETHSPTTDDNGIIALNIGEGTIISGTFSAIEWASDDHFLNVQVNIGSGLTDMGTTQFKTVPYAIASGDKSWEVETDNIHVLSKNVGIGTDSPTELLHIYDEDKAGINLSVPDLEDASLIEFKNGSATEAHTFFKIENRSDRLRFEVDSDLSLATGFESIMDLRYNGLAFNTGARITEFSSDGTLTDNSNFAVPTERAVKTYVDAANSNIVKTIVIPATAFITNEGPISYGATGPYVQKFSGDDPLYAPLIIPVGSTINSVTFYFRDVTNLGDVNIEGAVMSAYRTSFSAVEHFTVSTFGSSASGITEVHSTAFTTGTDRQYYIRVRPTSDWSGTELGLNSVKITYTE